MNIRAAILWLILGASLFAQGSFDLTGRVSLRIQNNSYDEDSDIKPDSVNSAEYGKSNLIPGLHQLLNISLFGRTRNLDMTLLADVRNNEWNRINLKNLNSVSRLTLNLRLFNHEIVLGDFFQSFTETFIQSREIRGGKYGLMVDAPWGANSFLDFQAMGGMVQRAFAKGERLNDLYRQFESSGQFRRLLAASRLKTGKRGAFDVSLHYLWGKDQKSSINESINEPLGNTLFGARANFYIWDRNLRFFGEFFSSDKDTLDVGNAKDNSFNAGVDLKYDYFHVMILYQQLGYNYFTSGYPFLENDKKGIKGQLGYAIPENVSFFSDFELYDDNLDIIASMPTTSTKIADIGATTFFKGWPEFTLEYGIRTDDSDSKPVNFGADSAVIKTEKVTNKIKAGVGLKLGQSRLSLSIINLDLDDSSILSSGEPLGTKQFITSLNFYTTSVRNLFLSGGAVYSTLTLTDDRENVNLYFYESTRWDIVPRKLKLETTLTYIVNEAENGGTADLLSDYNQINGEISLEYFFNDQISFKMIAGTDSRSFKYSTEEALTIIADPEFGPTYFNNNESYTGLIFGGELNWIF